ncbi:MAG: methyltransferase domain-containing protein [Christensenellales bacterium]|jgi:SAM-dependent methyltransferase/transcriptional regulator with XRE-family HTH domain
MDITKVIRTRRLEFGYSQRELADEAEVGVWTVRRLESGQRIQEASLRRIAEALELPVTPLVQAQRDELVSYNDQRQRDEDVTTTSLVRRQERYDDIPRRRSSYDPPSARQSRRSQDEYEARGTYRRYQDDYPPRHADERDREMDADRGSDRQHDYDGGRDYDREPVRPRNDGRDNDRDLNDYPPRQRRYQDDEDYAPRRYADEREEEPRRVRQRPQEDYPRRGRYEDEDAYVSAPRHARGDDYDGEPAPRRAVRGNYDDEPAPRRAVRNDYDDEPAPRRAVRDDYGDEPAPRRAVRDDYDDEPAPRSPRYVSGWDEVRTGYSAGEQPPRRPRREPELDRYDDERYDRYEEDAGRRDDLSEGIDARRSARYGGASADTRARAPESEGSGGYRSSRQADSGHPSPDRQSDRPLSRLARLREDAQRETRERQRDLEARRSRQQDSVFVEPPIRRRYEELYQQELQVTQVNRTQAWGQPVPQMAWNPDPIDVQTLEQAAPRMQEGDMLSMMVEMADITRRDVVLLLGADASTSRLMARNSDQVVILDSREDVLNDLSAVARRSNITNMEFILGDARRMPLPSGSIDIVAVHMLLHHVVCSELVMEEAMRVLQPGGRVIVSELMADDDPSQVRMHNAVEVLRSPNHVGVMTLDELRMTVQHAGFDILDRRVGIQEMDFNNWAKNTPADRVRILRPLMMNLARQNNRAGINLQYENDRLQFDYKWMFMLAEKTL